MQDTKLGRTILEKTKALLSGRLEQHLEPILKIPEDKAERERLKRRAGEWVSFALAGFLFSLCELKWGARPLGFALMLAGDGGMIPAAIGIMCATLVGKEGFFINLLCCFAAVTVRISLCRTLGIRNAAGRLAMRESVYMRMALGSIIGFVIGMHRVIAGGFEKSGLYFAVIMMLVTPAAVWLYDRSINGERYTAGHDAGVLAIMFSTVLSLRGVSFIGISPAIVAATFLTLLSAFLGGALRGGITGMICGLGCSVSISPMLGIAGAVAGMTERKESLLPMLSFCGVGIAYSVMSEGLLAFSSTLPNLFWGVAVFAPTVKLGLLQGIYGKLAIFGRESSRSGVASARLLSDARCDEEREARIRALSEAFSSLSSVFYALSNRLSTPGAYQIRELCEECFKKYCNDCGACSVCWGRDYERISDVINKLANSVAKHGRADTEYIPGDFFAKCPSALKALSDLNLAHARILERAAKENKTEIFALDYEAMSRLLEGSCRAVSKEFEIDPLLTERVRRACDEIGLMAENVAVYGQRCKSVVAGGVDISSLNVSAEEISDVFGRICGVKMSPPEFSLDKDYSSLRCRAAKRFRCKSAKASLKKENETVNGDSCAVFSGRDDRFYALVSDGMGSGNEAAITSRVSCIFLEKMLSAGNKKSVVLRMLNDFLKNKSLECFATVDLLEVDLISGEASFIKGGAACSYVMRGDKLFRISSSSLPIGITKEISAEEIALSIRAGDLIIMISDGISQGLEDGAWLADLLCSDRRENEIDRLAEQILDAACEKNRRSDDMTVMIVQVEEG